MPQKKYVALLRGINVAKTKWIPMAELRQICEQLGYTGVTTLLNSGNVVFNAAKGKPAQLEKAIEHAITARFGFSTNVTVFTEDEFHETVDGNSIVHLATSPPRFMVAFLKTPEVRERLLPLTRQDWTPDALALGKRAAYYWCEAGIIESKLSQAVGKAHGDQGTARNWATVLKIQALLRR